MNTHRFEDTPLNLYLDSLRDKLYEAVGIGEPMWMRAFEDAYFRLMNRSNTIKFALGLIMYEATHAALCGDKVHYQKIIEQFKILEGNNE